MQNPPQITVFIPAYKHEKYVTEAIKSLLDQTFSDFEAIVIDDASPDMTFDAAKKAAMNDPRFTFILHGSNQGNVATYNQALSIAKGKYIVMLASDDIYDKRFFESCMNAFQKYPDAGAVYTDHNTIDAGSNVTARASRRKIFGSREYLRNELKSLLFSHNDRHVPHSGTMARREVYEKFKYDPNAPTLCDWLLWMELSLYWKMVYIPECLYNYRVHGQNMHIQKMRVASEEKECRYVLKKMFSHQDFPKDISKKLVYFSTLGYFILKYLKRFMLKDVIRLKLEAIRSAICGFSL